MPRSPESSPAALLLAPPSRLAPLVVFVLLVGGAVLTGLVAYRIGEMELRDRRAVELAETASAMAEQVVRWRGERMSDAQVLAADPTLFSEFARTRARGEREAEEHLALHLETLRMVGGYSAIAIVGASGAIRVKAGPLPVHPGRLREMLAAAMGHEQTVMSDLHVATGEKAAHLDVVAPLPRSGAFGGAVLLRIDPQPSLFPLVNLTAERKTAEALLVQTVEGEAVVLNGTRATDVAFSQFPLDRRAARTLLLRHTAMFDGRDRRGVRVLAVSAPVTDTPWNIVVMEEEAATLAPLRDRALAIGSAVLALAVAAAAAVGLWWALQARRFERVRAIEKAQREALAARLERLGTYVQDMLLVSDERQRLVEANERAARLLGYSREEMVGMSVRDLRDPDTLGDYDERERQKMQHGAALFETRYRRKDGSTFPVQVSSHVTTFGGRVRVESIVRDLTDAKAADRALRESEEKFRAAFEHTTLGVALVAPDGRLLGTNGSMQRMSGHGEAELLGMNLDELYGSLGGEAPGDAECAQLLGGVVGSVEFERRLLRKDGTFLDTVVRAGSVSDGTGAPKLVVALVEDVSEKKRMEAQLLRADRLASVGTLAAGVAHEINNPLSFILSNLQFASRELSGAGVDPEILRALEDATDGGVRVREIVRGLNDFSRPGGEASLAVDLRTVLDSAVVLAGKEIRERARLVVVRGDVPDVAGDVQKLAQVMVNLLVNAARSIPPGDVSGNTVKAETSTAPDGRALVEIADTGRGIAPEALPRIFDPFFTTGPTGTGTGLGLSICHGIVSSLGGEISVESAVGRGSTFRVHLPALRRAERAGRTGATSVAPAGIGPRPRILVVDDEPLVARAVSRTLAASHEVVALTSARDALARIASGAESFDAVLCDLMMPDMTGMEFHARLSDVAPGLAARTLFLTGGAFTDQARAFLDRFPGAWLSKPFEARTLREFLSRVLARGRDGAAPR